jgi:hypothetical protein
MIEFIETVDGLDTVALQRKCPELFNVTNNDGVPNWTLWPQVFETLRIVRISCEVDDERIFARPRSRDIHNKA